MPLQPEIAARIFENFNRHRRQIIDKFWSNTEFQDLTNSSLIDTWTLARNILRHLWRHLPFGRHLAPYDYNDLIANFSLLREDACEQLFYWNTAGPLASRTQDKPVESATLFINPTHFWFTHVAPIQQQLKNSILFGHHIRYLEIFHLDYEQLKLQFTEIRLAPVRFGTTPLAI